MSSKFKVGDRVKFVWNDAYAINIPSEDYLRSATVIETPLGQEMPKDEERVWVIYDHDTSQEPLCPVTRCLFHITPLEDILE